MDFDYKKNVNGLYLLWWL